MQIIPLVMWGGLPSVNIVIGAEVFPYNNWASLGSRSGVRNVVATIEREIVLNR